MQFYRDCSSLVANDPVSSFLPRLFNRAHTGAERLPDAAAASDRRRAMAVVCAVLSPLALSPFKGGIDSAVVGRLDRRRGAKGWWLPAALQRGGWWLRAKSASMSGSTEGGV
jgi:hypothetical protein